MTRDVYWHDSEVSAEERVALLGGVGYTVWFTGLSASGKSTLAVALERELLERGRPVCRLDGDNLRHGLNAGLGFSEADRQENVRRVGEVALIVAGSAIVAIASLISPYRADRDRVRARHVEQGLRFLEVYVDCPLAEAERRDPKGLYRRARAGTLPGFTGIDAPYEAPLAPELRLATAGVGVEECLTRLVRHLEEAGLLAPR